MYIPSYFSVGRGGLGVLFGIFTSSNTLSDPLENRKTPWNLSKTGFGTGLEKIVQKYLAVLVTLGWHPNV